MELEKIMTAGGHISMEDQAIYYKELNSILKIIHKELGDKSGLLDDYISAMLKAFQSISVMDAVEDGFQDATAEIRELIMGVRDNNNGITSHPFYSIVSSYISEHPCPSEKLYVDYYCGRLFIEFTDFSLNRFLDKRAAFIRSAMEAAHIDEIKAQIAELIDPDLLSKFYELICKRYLIASPSKMFLQCMTDQHVLNCLAQDNDSRYVFQHIIENE